MAKHHGDRNLNLEQDVLNGKVQQLIDDHWQQADLLKRYECSMHTLRKYINSGQITFTQAHKRMKHQKAPTFAESLSPMRRLALCEPWSLK
jgi:hypothetical protein